MEIVLIVEDNGEHVPEKRQLIRENGRLIVAALPGERQITDRDVRRALNEWSGDVSPGYWCRFCGDIPGSCVRQTSGHNSR